jgi:hypothetical protein
VEELHVYLDTQTQQSGPYRDTDAVQALGARWTRDASKHAASIQLGHQPELDGPPSRSRVDDDDMIVAPAPPYELTAASLARELPHEREVPGGVGIDP